MSCSSPGSTHHAACDCREADFAASLATADRALFAERERVVNLGHRLAAAEARCAELEAHIAAHPDRCTAEAKCLPCRTAEEATLRAARYEAALRPFVDPESYSTSETECRRNAEMDWCAVHSFRWPCPVGPARAVLAGGGDAEREKEVLP